MKKLLIFIAFISLSANSQITNRLLGTQNTDSGINPPNIMYTVPPNDNRIYQTSRSNLLIVPSQITGLSTFITDIGNINYKPLTYAPTSSEIELALGYVPFNPTGLLNQYISGNGTYVNFPFIPVNKSDIGLPNVDNTSDINKPLSSAMILALAGKLSAEADGSITNEIQTIYKSGDNLSISGGNTISLGIPNYTAGTGIGISGGVISNTSAYTTPTINSIVSRFLNTNFTISTTKQSIVSYTVRIAYNVTVLLGSTGTIDLQYSVNSGSTWITVSTVSNSLNLGLALTGYNDYVLSGSIPANALVRLNSTVTNATNTYRTGQETY